MAKKAGIDSTPETSEDIISGEVVALETVPPEIESTVESVKPEESVQVREIMIMSLKEFASSLSGSDVLLACAMNKEFLGQRLSKSAWTNALKRFGNREA